MEVRPHDDMGTSESTNWITVSSQQTSDCGSFNALPEEIIFKILFLVDDREVRLLNRQIYRIGWEALDPSINESAILRGAVKVNNIAAVKKLIQDKRIDLLAKDNLACKLACKGGFSELLKLLLSDLRVNLFTLFEWATDNSEMNAAKRLLDEDRLIESSSLLWWSAIWNNKLEVIKLLLAHPKIEPPSAEEFEDACKHGRVEIVKLFLADPRIDPSAHGNWAIKVSYDLFDGCKREIVTLLLGDRRVNPTGKGVVFFKIGEEGFSYQTIGCILEERQTEALIKIGRAKLKESGLESIEFDGSSYL